jgi:formiminotetrahydrofolate cyclodeaminase
MSDSFLTALAKPQPDPGGGAAAAHGALIGLALLEKIVVLEKARGKEQARSFQAWQKKEQALTAMFLRMKYLREADRKIYPKLVKAKRSKAPLLTLNQVITESIAVPLEIMQEALKGFSLIAWVGTRCKKHLQGDVLVAGELLMAVLYGAFHIGSSNLPLIKEIRQKRAIEKKLIEVLRKGEETWGRIKGDLSFERERGHS